MSSPSAIPVNRLILATRVHKGAQRKEENRNHLNKKFLRMFHGF
jgi:hypothetical protein